MHGNRTGRRASRPEKAAKSLESHLGSNNGFEAIQSALEGNAY